MPLFLGLAIYNVYREISGKFHRINDSLMRPGTDHNFFTQGGTAINLSGI